MTSVASNSSIASAPSSTQLLCPLLDTMRNHTRSNDTGVNMVVVCVHGVVSCLGILENALVLWALGFRLRRKTVASVWVLNLALSDFLATLTLPLFTHYLKVGHTWELGQPLCSVQSSIFFLNMFVSAFLLAAISIDRCLLVAWPVWSQNHRSVAGAWKICGLGWLWAAANTFPYFLFRSVTMRKDGRKLCYHNFALYSSQATLSANCEARQAATAVSKTLLAFVIPFLVIAVSYAHFGRRLQARRKRRSSRQLSLVDRSRSMIKSPFGSTPSSPTSDSAEQLSRSFTKMVATVITAFALCWAPYHIFCLLEVAAHYREDYRVLVEVALPLATTIAFLNPVLNPVIYAFSCPHFCTRIRQSLGALFEGLVEEAGPLTFPIHRSNKWRDPKSPASVSLPSSPNTPTPQRVLNCSQGSINLYSLIKNETGEKQTEQKEGKV
ncbi:prostaglandin D2 receptor 2 [Chanos chanos]|uniref:Prostaglandin D2 receptor 2 n=1 Tax=Chanos chanos TaxID=29144 RepID=A0A6J2WDW6_CHACN|nr:prostaglandin D2 receptor 2-like [Chanos chanos]